MQVRPVGVELDRQLASLKGCSVNYGIYCITPRERTVAATMRQYLTYVRAIPPVSTSYTFHKYHFFPLAATRTNQNVEKLKAVARKFPIRMQYSFRKDINVLEKDNCGIRLLRVIIQQTLMERMICWALRKASYKLFHYSANDFPI